ncbi:MAG: tetratricopeptide repeat protein, partial [Caldilineaceae bacterium]|nr:tetratricopeptide repeat protein [Caldilineaceae bacterium]
ATVSFLGVSHFTIMTNPETSHDFPRILNESAHLLRQNRPAEAAELLEPLHEHAPEHPDVAINLGGAYILQRKWNQAAKILSRAAISNPDNAMLWTNLGAAELGNIQTAGPKQQERAIRAYERALQADPTAPNVHYHLGLIYTERGELMRASAFFQRALEVKPSDRDARYWLDQVGKLIVQEQAERRKSAETDDSN